MLVEFLRYLRRKKYLESRGWYCNMNGGMTEGHCMLALERYDIMSMSDEEFALIAG